MPAPSDWELPGVATFDGQEVRYGIIGDGPPLVLVHGTPFSSVVWHRVAPHLACLRRVYYWDLLGYGRSEMRAGQDVSLGVQNRVFSALLDHWGSTRQTSSPTTSAAPPRSGRTSSTAATTPRSR